MKKGVASGGVQGRGALLCQWAGVPNRFEATGDNGETSKNSFYSLDREQHKTGYFGKKEGARYWDREAQGGDGEKIPLNLGGGKMRTVAPKGGSTIHWRAERT